MYEKIRSVPIERLFSDSKAVKAFKPSNNLFHNKDRQRHGWLTRREILPFLRSVASIFRFPPEMVIDVKRFSSRLIGILGCNGWTFLFTYMKECSRLTARRLLTGQISTSLGKPFVRMDKEGLPSIIPLRWRLLLLQGDPANDRLVVGILSCLTIFRCFPTKVKESLDSITGPFTGVTKTLDRDLLSRAILDLGIKGHLRIARPRFITLSSAGPNVKVAMWGGLLDMLSLVRDTRLFVSCFQLMLVTSRRPSLFNIAFLIFSLFALFPFVQIGRFFSYTSQIVYKTIITGCYASGIISSIEIKPSQFKVVFPSWLRSRKFRSLASGPFSKMSIKEIIGSVRNSYLLHNGKLAVVFDQAGKARIVAMTNYWIQCLFRPIHDSLFEFLRTINFVDGTFDQEGCIYNFMDTISPDQMIYSFDLSAATDRLPLELQEDTMSVIFGDDRLAQLWASIIRSIKWFFKGEYCSYSVGQPMGAYSSWAMLATTHHVIVRAASLRCGLVGFSDYLVLGDDIVIANDLVAEEYLRIMHSLGLEVNLQKSMIGKGSCEFAKKWMIGQRDLSPIGAKLILQSIRSRDSMFLVLTDLLRRGLVSLSTIPVVIEGLGPRFKSLGSWALYALISGFHRMGEEVRYQYEDTGSGVNRFDPTSGFPLGYNTKENLINNYLNEVISQDEKASSVLENIIRNWRNVDFYRKSGFRFWGVLNLLNPGLWLTLKPLFRYDEYLWDCVRFAHAMWDRPGDYEVINDLRLLDTKPNILDIDFKDKVAVSGLREATWEYFGSLDIQTQDALSYWVAFKSNVNKWHEIQSRVRPPEPNLVGSGPVKHRAKKRSKSKYSRGSRRK